MRGERLWAFVGVCAASPLASGAYIQVGRSIPLWLGKRLKHTQATERGAATEGELPTYRPIALSYHVLRCISFT